MRTTRGLALAALVALSLTTACGAPSASGPAAGGTGDAPDKPGSAVTLNILDVAGDLQLTQGMIDDFVAKNSGVVAKPANGQPHPARRARAG